MELLLEGQPARRPSSILKSRNSIASTDHTEDIEIAPPNSPSLKRRVSFSQQKSKPKQFVNAINTTQYENSSMYTANSTNITMADGDPLLSTTRFNDNMDTTIVQDSMIDQTSFYDELMSELTDESVIKASTTTVNEDDSTEHQEGSMERIGTNLGSNKVSAFNLPKHCFGNFANPGTPRRPQPMILPLSMLSVESQTSPSIFGNLDKDNDQPVDISVRSGAVAIPNFSSKSENKWMVEKEILRLPNKTHLQEKTMMISSFTSQNIRDNKKTPSEIKIPSKQPCEEIMAKHKTCKSMDESIMQLSVVGSRAVISNLNPSFTSSNQSVEEIENLPKPAYIQEKTMVIPSVSSQNLIDNIPNNNNTPSEIKIASMQPCEESMTKHSTYKNKNSSMQQSVVVSHAAAAIPNLSSKSANKSMEIEIMPIRLPNTTHIQEKTMINTSVSFQNPLENFHKASPAPEVKLPFKQSCEELMELDTTCENKDEPMEVSIGSRAAAIPISNSSFKSTHENLRRMELSRFTHHYIKNFKSFHGIQMVNALHQIELELDKRSFEFDDFIKQYGFAFSSKWIEMLQKKIEFRKSMKREIQDMTPNQS